MRIISILTTALLLVLLVSCEKEHIQDANVTTLNDLTLVKPKNDKERAEAEALFQTLQQAPPTVAEKSTTCCKVISFFVHPHMPPPLINLSVRYNMNQPTQQIRILNYLKTSSGHTYVGYIPFDNSKTDCNDYGVNIFPRIPSGDYISYACIWNGTSWCSSYVRLDWTRP